MFPLLILKKMKEIQGKSHMLPIKLTDYWDVELYTAVGLAIWSRVDTWSWILERNFTKLKFSSYVLFYKTYLAYLCKKYLHNLLQIHENQFWINQFTNYEIKQNPTSTVVFLLVLNIIQIRVIH